MKSKFLSVPGFFLLLSFTVITNCHAQNCPAPHDQDIVTFSGVAISTYVFWLPNDPSDTITYDIYFKCSGSVCGHTTIQAGHAIHTSYGYIGIPISTTGAPDKASIVPLGCPPNFKPLDPYTGELITDNIDATWNGPHTKVKTVDQSAENLTAAANTDCDALGGVYFPSSWPIDPQSGYPLITINLYYNNTTHEFRVQNTTPVWFPNYSVNDYIIQYKCGSINGATHYYYMTAQFCDACRVGNISAGVSENGIQITPNPAGSTINIENVTLDNGETATISLMNSVGQLTGNWNNLTAESLSHTSFNVAGLPAGCYLVEVRSGSKVLRTKFMKE